MTFYNKLSEIYEFIFPVNEKTINFIVKNLKNGSDILDVACGAGEQSIELLKRGFNVDSIDLEGKMIEKAKKKSDKLNLSSNFIQGDMTKIDEIFKDKKFDCIFCIGNSIVHLEDKEKISKLIKSIYEMLKDNGKIVLQIVNYDKILKYGLNHLPTIKNEEENLEFIREYELIPKESKVNFNTKLMLKNTNEIFESSIQLITLLSDELKKMLEDANFENISFYGDFKGEKFNTECGPMIVEAYKIINK